MRSVRLALVAAVVLTMAACGQSEGSGDVRVGVSTAALTSDVNSVELTVSGAGISPDIVQTLTQDLVGDPSGATWIGDVLDIPAGTGRVFTARAYGGPSEALLYEGSATADINDGANAVVTIILNEVAPTGFSNVAPRFSSLVLDANPVEAGQAVQMTADASDPDETVGLTYDWFAADGTFDSTSGATVNWTAPVVAGVYQIQVTVTDSVGASSDLFFDMTVELEAGSASVTATVNNAPVVNNLTASDGQVDAGETVDLTLDVTDPEADAMTFSWTADCDGTFSDVTAQNPTFTLNTLPAGNPPADCTVSVDITDARGATNSASLSLATGPDVAPDVSVGQAGGTAYVNVPLLNPANPNFQWALAAPSSDEVVVGAVDSAGVPTAQGLALSAPDTPLWTTGTGASGSSGVDVSVDASGTTHLLARVSGAFRLTRISAAGGILAGNIPVSIGQPYIFDTAAMPDGSIMVAYTSTQGLSVVRVDSAGTASTPLLLQGFTGSMNDQVKVVAVNDDFFVSATAGNGNLEFFAHVDATDTVVTNQSNFTAYGLPLFAIGIGLLPSGTELGLLYRDSNDAVVGASFNFDGTLDNPSFPVQAWVNGLPSLRPDVAVLDASANFIVGYSHLNSSAPAEVRAFAPVTAAEQWTAVLEDPLSSDGLPVANEVADIAVLPNNDVCVLGSSLSNGNRQLTCFEN